MSRQAFLTAGVCTQALIFSSPAGDYLNALHDQRTQEDRNPSVAAAIAEAGWEASTMRHRRRQDEEFARTERWARTGEKYEDDADEPARDHGEIAEQRPLLALDGRATTSAPGRGTSRP